MARRPHPGPLAEGADRAARRFGLLPRGADGVVRGPRHTAGRSCRTPSGTSAVPPINFIRRRNPVFWAPQRLASLVAPTRRDDLKLSRGATAKLRENAVKQDHAQATNTFGITRKGPDFHAGGINRRYRAQGNRANRRSRQRPRTRRGPAGDPRVPAPRPLTARHGKRPVRNPSGRGASFSASITESAHERHSDHPRA